jgi:hypothetical protein
MLGGFNRRASAKRSTLTLKFKRKLIGKVQAGKIKRAATLVML